MTRYFRSRGRAVAVVLEGTRCRVRAFLIEDAAVCEPVGIGPILDENVPNGDETPRAVTALLIRRLFPDPIGGGPGRLHVCTAIDGDNELPTMT